MGDGQLRWAILGCARIARRGLIGALQRSEKNRLVALASRDGGLAERWAREFGVERAVGSYEDAVDLKDVDAVYIPLPNELHCEWVMRAADAGKHVLCEKPLARSGDEARRMVEHCRSRGVLLMEGFMWRHQARTRGLMELVESGAIGEVRLLRSSFSFSIAAGDWRLDPARGGGALFDVGCYGVNMARLFARSEPVEAKSMARVSETGVDMTLATELRFASGAIGLVDCSFEAPYRCSFELVGTNGSIEVPEAYLPAGPQRALVRGLGSDAGGAGVRELDYEEHDQYEAMVDCFADSVRAGRLVGYAEDGLAQARVLDLVRAGGV